ncbi:MAG: methyltransferase domain-containing protein [Deltaproteobacteria bacterium]|nr:methyltransferase domain-containing protein [Deltaproteobacteria bacterium]
MEPQMLEHLLRGVRCTFEGSREQQYRMGEVASGPMEAEKRLLQRIQAQDTVLDLGCAAGRILLPLAQRGIRVLGIDVALVLLREAAKLSQTYQISVPLAQGDPIHLPFKGNTFDKIIFLKTYCYVPGRANRIRWLSELQALLRGAGEVLFSQYVIDEAVGSYEPILADTAQRFPALVDQLEEGDGFSAPGEGKESPWYLHYFLECDLLAELREGGFVLESGQRKEHIFHGILKSTR